MKKLYIIGNSGYIGSSLTRKCNETGITVVTVGRKNADIIMDIQRDDKPLTDIVCIGDVVVFLAAVSSPDICNNKREYAEDINVTSTSRTIKNLISKGARVIFSSSDVVFGKSGQLAHDDSQMRPFGSYAEMKAAVEERFFSSPQFKVIRFSYVMGPGDKYTEMLLKTAKAGETLEVFEGFERNIVALSDVLEGILELASRWNDIQESRINFSGPDCISRWDMTEQFKQKFCPDLQSVLIEAPKEFWASRPKKIETSNNAFTNLLGRPAKNIQSNLSTWYR